MLKKVLIVDDDNEIFLFLKRIIKNKFNKESVWAENGLQALQMLEQEEIDAVVLDFNMPLMNGIEVLKVIRSNENLKNMPVIMCSSASDSHIVKSILSYNITDYLLKPLNYEESIKRLSQILKKGSGASTENFNKKHRILLAAGNHNDFNNFLTELEKHGDVSFAKSGSEAYSLFLSKKPKFVFIGDDLGLLDTLTLADKLKSLIQRPAEESKKSYLIYIGQLDYVKNSNQFNRSFNVFDRTEILDELFESFS